MDQKIVRQMIDLRHELHACPELSMKEIRTKKRLMTLVSALKTWEVQDRGSWFYARKKTEHPKKAPIAFRADMDALPMAECLELPYGSRTENISHKCGHDGHCAALYGLALSLDEREVERDVYLIFQPGEETGEGGRMCAELIPEAGIGSIYAFHNRSGFPRGQILFRRQTTQPASKGLTFSFVGKESHASAPEQGANPAEAIASLIRYASACVKEHRNSNDPSMLLCTVVYVHAGSKNFGIAAGRGEVAMTLRGEREEAALELEDRLRKKALELAQSEHLKISITQSDVFPATVNADRCVNIVKSAAEKCGYAFRELEEMWRASEDFGYYTRQCPGAMFYIGNGEDYPDVHTPSYDFPDENLSVAADMFAAILELDGSL